MSEQQPKTSQEPVPWWVQLCRLLWKIMAFLGTAVLVSLLVNVAST